MRISTITLVAFVAYFCQVANACGDDDDSRPDTGKEGEGFGFPLYGLPIPGVGFTAPEGLPLEEVLPEGSTSTTTDIIPDENGLMEEFVSFHYTGEKQFGEDLDEWVQRSKKSYREMVLRGLGQPEDWDDTDPSTTSTTPNRTSLRALNTFGVDNRISLSAYWMDKFPFRAVGHMLPVGCTGTMVAKNVFLTNRHCVLDSNGKLRYGDNFWSTMYLLLGRSDNTYNHKVYFNKIMYSNSRDWALVRTTSNVGSYTGYVGYKGRDWWYFVQDRTVSMISYSGEFFQKTGRPGVHIGCKSRGAQIAGNIRHDCDAERGSSGSSMLEGLSSLTTYGSGGPWVVGVNYAEYRNGGEKSLHLGSYSNKYANLFWPGSNFASKITEVRNNW